MSIFSDFNVVRSEDFLENGIRVVLFKREGAPITTTAILKSGSRHDPESMPGLSHFIEHMITNGSKVFPTKDLLAEHIESVGGVYRASTGQDSMIVDTEISDRADYSRVVDIFKATLCEPLMDIKVFENEKKVVVKEIKKSESNPSQIVIKTARQLFFYGTPLEHPVLGDEKAILDFKYEDVLDQHVKLFDKSRISIIVSGDIEMDMVIEKLNEISFLEGNNFLPKADNLNFLNEKKIKSTFFDTTQTYIYFGVQAPASFTKDSLHLNILGSILAGGRNSRLTKKLRYEKGLVYNVGFGRIGGVKQGSWNIITDTTEDKVQEVIDEIISEISDIRNFGVKDSELEFVKNKRIKSLKRNMQTSNDWVDFHAIAEVFSEQTYSINTYVEDIKNTTVEDIKKVIDKYLVDDKWKLALCGRIKEESVNINW